MLGRHGLPRAQGRARPLAGVTPLTPDTWVSGTRTPPQSVTPAPAPVEDDLREQLRAATTRAEDAERRAAVAEAIAAERARSLEDMRLTLRALTATPAPAPTPAPTPTPAPAVDDDGRAAAAWAEHPDRTIRPNATIHRGTAARDYYRPDHGPRATTRTLPRTMSIEL